MKTNLERVTFLSETEKSPIHKITSQQIIQTPTIHKNWPPQIQMILLYDEFCVNVYPLVLLMKFQYDI